MAIAKTTRELAVELVDDIRGYTMEYAGSPAEHRQMYDYIEGRLDELLAPVYALALLTEECGEVLQLIGKAGRFGLDTPGVKDPRTGVVDMTMTPRTMLPKELGDVFAAVDYSVQRGVIDGSELAAAHVSKITKLLSPASRDNLGRRLAP